MKDKENQSIREFKEGLEKARRSRDKKDLGLLGKYENHLKKARSYRVHYPLNRDWREGPGELIIPRYIVRRHIERYKILNEANDHQNRLYCLNGIEVEENLHGVPGVKKEAGGSNPLSEDSVYKALSYVEKNFTEDKLQDLVEGLSLPLGISVIGTEGSLLRREIEKAKRRIEERKMNRGEYNSIRILSGSTELVEWMALRKTIPTLLVLQSAVYGSSEPNQANNE